MGWIISVGKAGAKGKQHSAQLLSVSVDAHGVPARIKVYADADKPLQSSSPMSTRQAQRIWRNVLSTLTDTE